MSQKQLEANRRNARRSTGPRTGHGKAVSKLNALKHGILSREVLVQGRNFKESRRELIRLHERFRDALQPVGPVEEMLVDQIVTAHWRLRRALIAESGAIAVSVDGGQWNRERSSLKCEVLGWQLEDDPVPAMSDSAFGNRFLESQLREVRAAVEAEGTLTEAAVQKVIFRGKPYSLTRRLEEWRLQGQHNPEGLPPEVLRARQKEQVLGYIDQELRVVSWRRSGCETREQQAEEARQAAAVLPSAESLEKILRYETKLERQMYRAMAHLERLQRMRQGEAVPAPLSVEVSESP